MLMRWNSVSSILVEINDKAFIFLLSHSVASSMGAGIEVGAEPVPGVSILGVAEAGTGAG